MAEKSSLPPLPSASPRLVVNPGKDGQPHYSLQLVGSDIILLSAASAYQLATVSGMCDLVGLSPPPAVPSEASLVPPVLSKQPQPAPGRPTAGPLLPPAAPALPPAAPSPPPPPPPPPPPQPPTVHRSRIAPSTIPIEDPVDDGIAKLESDLAKLPITSAVSTRSIVKAALANTQWPACEPALASHPVAYLASLGQTRFQRNQEAAARAEAARAEAARVEAEAEVARLSAKPLVEAETPLRSFPTLPVSPPVAAPGPRSPRRFGSAAHVANGSSSGSYANLQSPTNREPVRDATLTNPSPLTNREPVRDATLTNPSPLTNLSPARTKARESLDREAGENDEGSGGASAAEARNRHRKLEAEIAQMLKLSRELQASLSAGATAVSEARLKHRRLEAELLKMEANLLELQRQIEAKHKEVELEKRRAKRVTSEVRDLEAHLDEQLKVRTDQLAAQLELADRLEAQLKERPPDVEVALRRRVAELEAELQRARGGAGAGKNATIISGSASFSIDDPRARDLLAELRRTVLKRGMPRVIDLFRRFDVDGSGKIDSDEFRKAMQALELAWPVEDMDLLYRSVDRDGSGSIEYKELNKLLRQGADVQLDAALKPGAVEIMKKQTSPKRTRNQAPSGPMKAVTIEGLRAALTANSTRVIDTFRKLDKDGDGTITRAEFGGALPLLGFDASRTDLTDELFKMFDSDGGGTISFDELNQKLRQGAAVELAAELKAGAVGAIELKARNKIAPGSSRRHLLGEQGSSIVIKKVTVAGVRKALAASYSRVIDFFKLMDKNGDGAVTKHEFRAGLGLLGIDKSQASMEAIDALFDSFDMDGSGELTFNELKTILRYEAARLDKKEVGEEYLGDERAAES